MIPVEAFEEEISHPPTLHDIPWGGACTVDWSLADATTAMWWQNDMMIENERRMGVMTPTCSNQCTATNRSKRCSCFGGWVGLQKSKWSSCFIPSNVWTLRKLPDWFPHLRGKQNSWSSFEGLWNHRGLWSDVFPVFFFFSQMHWNQSMPSFAERLVHVSSRAYLQDYVIGASMIMVALYFTCQESLAFVGCNQFRWTTTVVWSAHRVIAQCTVDWGINISPWMAMANRLWTAAHVAVRRLWTPRSTTAFSECMWVWASARYFLHFPSIQVSTYYIFNVYTVYSQLYCTWDLMYPREAFPVFCNTSCSHRLAGP